MEFTILSKLESARKELLDLGLRNSLLNYRLPSARGLHIVEEKSASLFNILVRQSRAMTFLGRTQKEGATLGETDFAEPDESAREESYADTRLQTNDTETVLAKRLLNTYYAAKTSIEEQGVNILYLALGMLHWYETDNSAEERLAPLLLIPVLLERSSARERFRVKWTQEEIGENRSLQAKMKEEFGILIPGIPEIEDFDPDKYYDEVEESVSQLSRWKVERDRVELGFFSFGKFLIYNDLDNSKWPGEKKPVEHDLLLHLFEDGFQEGSPTAGEDAFIDTETPAHELFQVIDADSSQVLAMLEARAGKNLVIQGPPGTGKSQTITNLIADAIGQGKKVLFVAEKLAALEVVKRRLDATGLGEACLELHSHKANKKDLSQELMRILELGKPHLQQLQQEVALLEPTRNELNDYAHAINTPIAASGLTAHAVIGHLLQLAGPVAQASLPKFPPEQFAGWNQEHMIRAEAFSDRMQARLKVIGTPRELLFWGCKLTVLLPAGQQALVELLQQCLHTITTLQRSGEETALYFTMHTPLDRRQAQQLVMMADLASRHPDLAGMNIRSEAWLLNQQDVQELLDTGRRLSELHAQYAAVLLPEAWEQHVLEIRQNLIAYGDKWYRFTIGAYNKTIKQLAAICKGPLPKDTADRLRYVDDILEVKRLTLLLKEHDPLARDLFGHRWQQLRSDWPLLGSAYTYLKEVYRQVTGEGCPRDILAYLEKNEDPAPAKKYFTELVTRLLAHQQAITSLLKTLRFDEPVGFPQKGLLQQPFTEQSLLLDAWLLRHAEIHPVITWNTLVETAREEGLEFLPQTAESWPEASRFMTAALQKSWYEFLLAQALTRYPSLRRFQRDSHEELVQQFRKLDLLNFRYNRGRAAFRHWEQVPRSEAGGQVNILRKEFNKKARLKPIRKVMEEAGLAIQAIKPVFMMSPLSIANFLPPGSVEFDLVIFDEASQVRPVDALGAILRGKQLIVVGDTKQLPPTSFFDSLTRETDDEDNVTADMQSILGMCQSQGLLPRMLRWHYRSRHESLITLSNHEFYENKLIIFPSPGSRHRMGLVYHHLAGTVYDRGKTRTNPKEAELVADAVIEHARNSAQLSLGVVAFSTAQRQAIQDALELRRRQFPEVEAYFKSHPHEPFFVKNLENVQGDERDVIFISIGYGRSEEGHVAMSFGPLNNEGGERRLNVLITRAKLRCEVFTNITSDDIDLSRTKSYGIRTLKSFLHFAQHGKLYLPEETGLPAESPFEENVYDQLTKLGYTVRKQVGSQGFFIDLAIVDPVHPGRFILGIECDGASYHSARSARDRDRLRQQVLENIGWKIHRIWSTDWFRNPEEELKRVVAAIEKATAGQALDDEAFDAEPAPALLPDGVYREEAAKDARTVPAYELAKLRMPILQQEIHLYPPRQLSSWVEEIVKVESPVHFDEMARRIADAAGAAKIGTRIREALLQTATQVEESGRIRMKGDFLWQPGMDIPQVRDRSQLTAASRKIKLISPEELTTALITIVEDAIAILPDAAATLTAKTLGFSRVTEEIRKEILDVITKAVAQELVRLDGGLLKAAGGG